jgi:hypothetical protein
MGVEPLPNIRDGILAERLVKTLRYIADMRRCQYVVQCPEGVRRRLGVTMEGLDQNTVRSPIELRITATAQLWRPHRRGGP